MCGVECVLYVGICQYVVECFVYVFEYQVEFVGSEVQCWCKVEYVVVECVEYYVVCVGGGCDLVWYVQCWVEVCFVCFVGDQFECVEQVD